MNNKQNFKIGDALGTSKKFENLGDMKIFPRTKSYNSRHGKIFSYGLIAVTGIALVTCNLIEFFLTDSKDHQNRGNNRH